MIIYRGKKILFSKCMVLLFPTFNVFIYLFIYLFIYFFLTIKAVFFFFFGQLVGMFVCFLDF